MRYLKKILLFFTIFCAATGIDAQSAYYGKITKYSNLYRLSSHNSAILAWLPEKTTVFITSDIIVNGFVPIIYMESGIEGYVYHDAIDFTDKVTDTIIPSSISTVAQNADTAILTVVNNTNRTLTLKIDNQNYTVVSNEEQRIVLVSGVHRYILFGPKFLPVVGVEIFNKRHRWKVNAMNLH